MSSEFPICRTCGVQYEHAQDRRHCPICEDERQYVPEAGQLWTTNQELRDILHWPDGAEARGALCTGDIFQVVEDRRWLSFMYSYPNLIPEHPNTIQWAVDVVEALTFDVIYGAWWGTVVTADASGAVARSAERYLRHIGR